MKQSPTFTAWPPSANRGSWLVLALICLSFLMLALPALSITLVSGGTTQYVIAKQTGCDSTTSQAATDFRTYIQAISGVAIPIYSYASLDAVPAKAVVIGMYTSPTLAREQIEMKVDGERLSLRGGVNTLYHRYAVFGFLEEVLGCRYYSPTVEYIPSMSTITVSDSYNVTETPSFEMRYIYQEDALSNATWCTKNRVNGLYSIDGTHNMYTVVPPATYWSTHREYYPLHGGVRGYNTIKQWLCFTNPDLPQIIADYVENRMASTASTTIINVGQGDWSDSCECTSCQTAYAEEGNAWSGVMLRCLNAAADIVAQSYPTRRIMTFAYIHTEKPGVTAPSSNLMIRLCHWGRCDLHGVAECAEQNPFERNLDGWQALTDPEQLYVWHYTTTFQSQAATWPNVYSLIPDIKYYWDNDVRGLFYQGVYWGKGCDLSALKQYLMAKAMWNKDVDAEDVYDDFMNGYYGPAADEMAAYIDYLEQRTRSIGWHTDGIFIDLNDIKANLLPPDVFADADELYDAAEAAALAYSQELYDRVHYDRLSLLGMHTYNKASFGRISSPADRFVRYGDNNQYLWKEAFNEIIGDRGCGGEWACDAKARATWRSYQGGDVLTIENNKVKLSACPWLQGLVISLIDKRTGRELLHEAHMSDDSDAYPYNGYYFETNYNCYGDPWLRAQTPVSSSVTTDGNGNQVLSVVTEYGISNWNPSVVTHRLTRTITLPPGDANSFTISAKVKNLYTYAYNNEKLEGQLALEGVNDYNNISVVYPDDSSAIIRTFPSTLNVKSVNYDNGKHGIRLTQTFDQTLPTTSVTLKKSFAGVPNSFVSQNSTGLYSLAIDEEKELLKQTWAISEIPKLEDVIWTDFRKTGATYDTDTSSTLTKNSGLSNAWDADATSTKRLLGDCHVECRDISNSQIVFGLNVTNSDATNNDIDYGIEVYSASPDNYCVARENGTRVGTAQLMGSNDCLRVERVGTTVYYKKNDTTFYTSAVSSSGPLMVDCSIYRADMGLSFCHLGADSYYEPPVVTFLTPASGTVFAPGDTIHLEAEAYITDDISNITKVEFYRGAKYLGEDTTSPYAFDWTNVPAGSYALTAKAYTDNSLSATTSAVNVRVNTLPAVSLTAPSDGATYGSVPSYITISADASDMDGTISKLEFYEDGNFIGEDDLLPYTFNWATPPTGSHTLTAVAIDSDGGQKTSTSVQVNVEVTPPTVSITSPAANAVIVGNSVTINATAADSDGMVAKVEFYNGLTKVGEDTSSPFSYNWTSVTGGNYMLQSKAIDNVGAVTNSGTVAISVWNTQDVGSTGMAGSASYSAGTFTATGAGLGPNGSADSFRYVHQTITGDCTIIARVASFTATVSAARAGVMVRGNTDANAQLASSLWMPQYNRDYYYWRTTTGANASGGTTFISATALPYWVKVVRTNDVFKSYGSANGTSWTKIGSDQTILMPDSVTIGLVVASGYTTQTKVATFDNVSVQGANLPPSVAITAPANGARYASVPASITLTATASDQDGTVSKVEFFEGANKIGEDTSSPFSYDWTNVADGDYTLTANATDNAGAATTTYASVTVHAGPNHLPAVNLTAPADDTIFNNTVPLTAEASDTDGTISMVEFYAGTTMIGQALASPYSFNWTDVPAGSYTVTAKAIDNEDGDTTSTSVDVTSNAQPTVSITDPEEDEVFNGNITVAATASDSDGSITKVEFFEGVNKLGEDTTSPYSYTWVTPPSGSYALTAVATDNDGGTTVSAEINVIENAMPTVSLTAPTDYQRFVTAPADITLTASASDSDGTLAKVEFYQGTTLLNTDSVSPYSYDWTGVSAGSYTLTAKATDNLNGVTTSSVVHVNVGANSNPTVSLTSPADGTVMIGTDVTITADASDSDGAIANVQFYDGATLIGEDSTSPYSYDWSGVPNTSHALTAKAIDNESGETTSSTATLNVWYTQDVGTTGQTCSASYSSGTFTVTGAGIGINTTADGFRYVYQAISGDCTIIARIASSTATSSSARVGVVVRETTDAGSMTSSSLWMPQYNRGYHYYRTTTGGSASYGGTYANGGALPYWVKVVRAGDVFKSYISANGTSWTKIGTDKTIDMGDAATLGLMVSTGNTTQTKTATFDNISITSP